MNASVTFLRRAPEFDAENTQGWTAHLPDCPATEHSHHIWAPYNPTPGARTNLSTQAGFVLGGHEKLARYWNQPWYVTVVHDAG